MPELQPDVLIIGGGAAGLAAALLLARARRSVLLIDGGEPRNAPATHMHGYLGHEGIPPGDFLAIGRDEVRRYGAELVNGTVTDVVRQADGRFRATTGDSTTVIARRVLLTTGLRDVLPDIPGLADQWGRGVMHCPYCHGWEARDQALVVIGTGTGGPAQAGLFRQWSDDVTFVVNRNINFTNICYTGCRFCAFAQRKGDADAYSLSTDEVADRAWEAHVAGATEVCMQGGIDPELPVTGYADLVRAVKKRVPSMHVHAFSPMEIANGVTRSGLSVREWLTSLREAGLDTIPGTAAEILDDEVRWVLTKGKLPTAEWINVVTTAHEVGLRSSSTMMYGHVDTPKHWVGHLNVLRGIQDRTGGFTEFVPLPFVHQSSPMYLAGGARPGPTHRDNRAVHALARIMLHGRIPSIQTSWVKLGIERTQVMLQGGADDLGGTLMEETISRMAGSENGSAKTVAELVAIAEGIGRPARQRSTDYSPLAA